MTPKWADICARVIAAALARVFRRIVLVSVLLVAAPAAAAERVVLLTERAGTGARVAESDAELLRAARGQLAEIGIEVVLMPGARASLASNVQRARDIAASSSTLAVVWFERRAASLIVFFYDPAGPRLYSRRLAASDSPAAASEEIAIVLRSAVSAAMEGAEVGMSEVRLPEPEPRRPEATRQPSATSADPRADDEATVRLGASYVGALYALGGPWQSGAALSLSLSRKPQRARWFAGFSYTYFPGFTFDELGTETEIRRHPAELFAGFEMRREPVWFIAEAALIADLVERSTVRVAEGFSATPDSRRWLWAVSTRLGGAIPLAHRTRFFFTLGAEFLLNRFDHVVATDESGTETVGSPMPARPRMELGLLVGLW